MLNVFDRSDFYSGNEYKISAAEQQSVQQSSPWLDIIINKVVRSTDRITPSFFEKQLQRASGEGGDVTADMEMMLVAMGSVTDRFC